MALLSRGLSGEPVRILQTKLGVAADGEFGPATEKALKDWQTKNGLAADGIAGPDTFIAMGLYQLVLLKQGTRGAAVKKLQEKLGAAVDGQYGPATERAVQEYQQKNGLVADGLAGPTTLSHMRLYSEMTPQVVAASQVPVAAPTSGAPAPAVAGAAGLPKMRSIWETIKGVFKQG